MSGGVEKTGYFLLLCQYLENSTRYVQRY